jgi:hypothetical protein
LRHHGSKALGYNLRVPSSLRLQRASTPFGGPFFQPSTVNVPASAPSRFRWKKARTAALRFSNVPIFSPSTVRAIRVLSFSKHEAPHAHASADVLVDGVGSVRRHLV